MFSLLRDFPAVHDTGMVIAPNLRDLFSNGHSQSSSVYFPGSGVESLYQHLPLILSSLLSVP